MKSWIRHFLPFGLVRALQWASEFERIGLARRHAFSRNAAFQLQNLNLNLLPDGALAGAPACIIDVGANAGNWAGGVLDYYTPARLVCIEPDPRLAAGLRTRFAGRANISVIDRAVGSAPGTAELQVMENPVFNSLRAPDAATQAQYPSSFRVRETVKVEIQTLDTLLADVPAIRLLKIDVQGFEREVIAGAGAVLQRTDFVLMEVNFQTHYQGEAGFGELLGMMSGHGFCLGNYSQPHGGQREALYADAVFVRKTAGRDQPPAKA
jgi:FkbM family methyltransferase